MNSYKVFIFSLLFLLSAAVIPASAQNEDISKYPETIGKGIINVKNNFNSRSIDKLYTEFTRHKGIDDPVIAYSLVEIALNHEDKLNRNIIDQIIKFAPGESKKIQTVLSDSFLYKLFNYYNFFNSHILLKSASIIASIFVFILFIYLLIKNNHIFFHSHKNVPILFNGIKFVLFFGLLTSMLLLFPLNKMLVFAVFSLILLITETGPGRYFCIIVIILCVSVLPFKPGIMTNEEQQIYNDVALKPLSAQYMKKIWEKSSKDPLLKTMIALKAPETFSYNAPQLTPENKTEAVNFASLALYNGNTEKFNKIVSEFSLSDNPVIIMNMNTFFMQNFMYEQYENYIEKLYKSPKYYNVFQNNQLKLGRTSFFPYYKDTVQLKPIYSFNWFSSTIYALLLLFAIILHFAFSRRRIVKCESCGKTFCRICDEGHLNESTCSLCRNINSRYSTADPSVMVKKKIQAEKYKSFRETLSFFLTLLLPGCGLIYNGYLIFGVILTLIFSKIIFILLFKFNIFIWPFNLGIQYAVMPGIIVLFIIFIAVYLLSFLFIRRNYGS